MGETKLSNYLNVELYAAMSKILGEQNRIPYNLTEMPVCMQYSDLISKIENSNDLPIAEQRAIWIYCADTEFWNVTFDTACRNAIEEDDVFAIYALCLAYQESSDFLRESALCYSSLSFYEQVIRLLCFDANDSRTANLLSELSNTVLADTAILTEYEAIWIIVNYELCCRQKIAFWEDIQFAIYYANAPKDSVFENIDRFGISALALSKLIYFVRTNQDLFKHEDTKAAKEILMYYLALSNRKWEREDLLLLILNNFELPISVSSEVNFDTLLDFNSDPHVLCNQNFIKRIDDELLKLKIAEIRNFTLEQCKECGVKFEHWYYKADKFYKSIGLECQEQWSDEEKFCFNWTRKEQSNDSGYEVTFSDLCTIVQCSAKMFAKTVSDFNAEELIESNAILTDIYNTVYYTYSHPDFTLDDYLDDDYDKSKTPLCNMAISDGLLLRYQASSQLESVLKVYDDDKRHIVLQLIEKQYSVNKILTIDLAGIDLKKLIARDSFVQDAETYFAMSLQKEYSRIFMFRELTLLSTKQYMHRFAEIRNLVENVILPCKDSKYGYVWGKAAKAFVLDTNIMLALCTIFNFTMKSFYSTDLILQWCQFATKDLFTVKCFEDLNPVMGDISGYKFWLTNGGFITMDKLTNFTCSVDVPLFSVSDKPLDGYTQMNFVLAGSISDNGYTLPIVDRKIYCDVQITVFAKRIN